MAEEPALCRGVSVPLPERFGLNIFQPRRCPFGTQLNEFSRGSNSVQFQKNPENRASSLIAAKKRVTCRKNLVKKIESAKVIKIWRLRCA